MKTLDTHSENIPIAVLGLNHQTADVNIREKAAVNEKQQSLILRSLTKKFNTRGVMVLSTCNRTEIYLCGRKAIKFIDDIRILLDSIKNTDIFQNNDITYFYTGKEAVRHYFRVVSSLDSQIIGESQITGQIKDSYERSRKAAYTDILLNKMYHFGMQVEKQVRNKTYLTEGAVSVSFAGVELARKIFGDLKNTTVLLIGAGETAELAAAHFAKKDVSKILIANRTLRKAEKFAEKFNGEAVKMSKIVHALEQADIVITATSSDHFVVDKHTLQKVAEKRDYRPLFMIDLAIPRDIDPEASQIDGIFLFNLDDLNEVVGKNIENRKKEIPRAEKIIVNHVSEYLSWYKTLPVVQTITQLSQYFEQIRQQEFERLKNRFSKDSLTEAEYLSKSLMKKFLHHHIMSLRKSNQDPGKQKQHIDLVGEIYRLNGADSKTDKRK